ncbi:single-stranded DNA-binding protein (plasmid) [Arsenophonus nasoniae]|uniref:Single-stranded DNA-binding protein n=1 Tax=Arsenophonus nasoniae TaxID=638 RepID=A0A4P7L2S0_9GAMM|nr:single-stranded DNA-binding protein [Arsenophonus nasoniae]QBY46995.1 Single-stranded DNA-binding protein [Arsenophonus nasoniae]WGM18526.1 single-stranded DNA-binding protein [Arsenophonus nasoniae]
MTINTVIFSGNLGNDCITRSTTNGKLIATFSLPVTQGYGESKKISWVECRMFGAKAEKLPIYLKKGTKVTVSGQLLIDKWTGNDGKEKTTVVVLVNDIDFTGSSIRQENQLHQASKVTAEQFDEEIPF